MRRVLWLVLFAGCVGASADEPKPEPVLHEYVPPPKSGSSRIVNPPPAAPGSSESTPTAGPDVPNTPNQNPTAIRQNDKILVEPSLAQPPGKGEPIHGTQSDRETEVHPDNSTRQDGTLHYAEVYNPSTVPFKRMSSLDAVHGDYTMYVADRTLRETAVGGQATLDRDLFWGNLVLRLDATNAGKDIPIPSVSPDMRILSYETQPPARLVFSKDGADNYFVRTQDPHASGQLRIVFLVDAGAAYFAPNVPAQYTIADVAALHPPAPIAPRAREAASLILDRIGVNRASTLPDAVDRLVEYFRGFQAGVLPPSTGDIYLDLASSRRGVCRHRAFAFMVTANAVGLPARYVSNEAHAFAEVWVPDRGWLRVDLGGAALTLDVANANDKAMYRPRAEDPFPKPPAYADNYTKLRGNVQGLSPDQLSDAQRPITPSGSPNPGSPGRDPHSTDPVVPAPGTHLPKAPASASADKKPLTIAIDSVDKHAFRGENIRVAGHVRDGGQGAADMRVDIYLAPAGSGGDGARLVGQTLSDKGGGFSTVIDLPADMQLGQHEVYAATPGNVVYAPALSD